MKSFDCELYMDLMPLVKDGAASESSRMALEAHLQSCGSCRAVYETLPETAAGEDTKTLKKIRRRLNLITWTVVLCASLVGAILSQTSQMGYNLILFPVVGIVAYCAMGIVAWRTAPGVAAFCMIISVARSTAAGEGLLPVLGFSLCYGAVFLLGVGLAWIVHSAFTKPSEGPRWKHASMCALALALTVGTLYVINMFAGNPISRTAVQIHSQQYLIEKYPDLQLERKEVYYDWYSGGHYEIEVTSAVSPDTRFSLFYDELGRLSLDTYEDFVASGLNTLRRLENANFELMEGVQPALQEKLGIYPSFLLASDWASMYDGVIDYPFRPEERIMVSELEVDGEYDARAMAKTYGIVAFNGAGEVSEAGICQVLLELKDTLRVAGLEVATVDVHLYNDLGEDIKIAGFPYEAIGTENMEQLVHEAVLAWEEFEIRYNKAIEELNANR